ncbi:MAG: division/cell wall cluster transcriptional repressor MraZ [Planctomycetota bacterium]
MLMLTGEYEHTIDGKSRLFVSNKLRSQIDSDTYGSNFYLAMGSNGIYCLYPEKYFQQIALAGAPGIGAPDESVSFSKVELDRQGRLLINEKLRKRANLGTVLTLVGVRDHIEIWNTDDWERYLDDNLHQFHTQLAQARQTQLQKTGRDMEP